MRSACPQCTNEDDGGVEFEPEEGEPFFEPPVKERELVCDRGETCCASEEGDEHPCCVHEPLRRDSSLGAVCCWCGCCYMPRELHDGTHGKHRPKSVSRV